jgi:hypothetical protein
MYIRQIIRVVPSLILGLAFVVFGLNFFLHFIEMPPPPKTGYVASYMGAMYPSGYLGFVKVLEVLGGLLIVVPKLRNLGLLILGPILVNIVCFQYFFNGAKALLDPVLVILLVSSLAVLWQERQKWLGLIGVKN